MRKILTELEWFEEYYPKHWGDFTKEYNLNEYLKSDETACSWMCYENLGYLSSEDGKGIMKVNKRDDSYLRDNHKDVLFIECSKEDRFIQPYQQPKDGRYFFKVVLSKEESNLDLWRLYVVGCDDSSYTSHYIGYQVAKESLDDIVKYGIGVVECGIGSDWFFSN